MDTYCKVDLSTQQIVDRGNVPAALIGLSAEVLADPASHLDPCPAQHAGYGYWPILYEVPPYEPATQRLSDQMDEALDPTMKAITVRRLVVNLTTAEIEAKAAAAAGAFADAQAAAVAANNAAAGKAREAYLTAVPGQATTYAAKQAEVQRWIAAGRPGDATADAYPWAGDRADLRAVTVADVLAEWEAVTAAWEAAGRLIERERERVNEAIAAASTPEAIQVARNSAAYPSP